MQLPLNGNFQLTYSLVVLTRQHQLTNITGLFQYLKSL